MEYFTFFYREKISKCVVCWDIESMKIKYRFLE